MKTILRLCVFIGLMFGALPVFAQPSLQARESSSKCIMAAEKIVNMGKPVFGGAMKWKRALSQDGDTIGKVKLVRLFDAIDYFLVVGEYHDPKTYATSMQVFHMDFHGKLLKKSSYNLKTIGQIIEVSYTKKSLYVLFEKMGGDGKRHAQINVYSHTGKLLRSKLYKDKGAIIIPTALTIGDDGHVYMATQHKKNATVRGVSSALYKLDKSLNVVWKRSFLPSTPSRIHALSPRQNGGFMVAGEIAVPGGRNRQRVGGWLMALSPQGGMEWQRAYPRGYDARLQFVHETKKGHIFTAGTAQPSGDGKKSGWVMTNYANSNPIWQRYFTGAYDYETVGFHVTPPHHAAVLLQGTTDIQGGVDHARLLDLSSLGDVMSDRSYLEGNGVDSHHLASFDGDTQTGLERYILGSAKNPSPEGQDLVLDGWIASIYKSRKTDPCQ